MATCIRPLLQSQGSSAIESSYVWFLIRTQLMYQHAVVKQVVSCPIYIGLQAISKRHALTGSCLVSLLQADDMPESQQPIYTLMGTRDMPFCATSSCLTLF